MINFAFISLLFFLPQESNSATLSDGTSLEFDSIVISNDQLTLTSNELVQSINTETVELIEFANRRGSNFLSKIQTQLSNGSRISCGSFSLDGEVVKLNVGTNEKQEAGIAIVVSRTLIRSIKLDESISPTDWKRMLAIEIASDGLVIERDGELDMVEGIIKSINAESLQFDFQGRVNEIKMSRLAGIRFFQPKREYKTELSVQDTFGNTFSGSKVELDDSKLKLSVARNEYVSMPKALVANINFAAGRFEDLSQLRPGLVEWKPFFRSNIQDESVEALLRSTLSTRRCWTANNSFGVPLSLRSREKISHSNPTGRIDFSSGISILGGSTLVFTIPEDAKRFTAMGGIQLGSHSAGSVLLRLSVDGKRMFEESISAADKTPTPISFDLPNATDGIERRLTIYVGYGPSRQVGDVLSLCNARFAK